MLSDLTDLAGFALSLLAVAFALIVGDAWERQGATVYFVGWLGSIFVVMDRHSQGGLDPYLAIDLVMLGAFVLLAWKSCRAWPVWAAAFLGIEIMVDVMRDAGMKVDGRAVFYALNISSYGVLVALTAGAWVAWREREALRTVSGGVRPRFRL